MSVFEIFGVFVCVCLCMCVSVCGEQFRNFWTLQYYNHETFGQVCKGLSECNKRRNCWKCKALLCRLKYRRNWSDVWRAVAHMTHIIIVIIIIIVRSQLNFISHEAYEYLRCFLCCCCLPYRRNNSWCKNTRLKFDSLKKVVYEKIGEH